MSRSLELPRNRGTIVSAPRSSNRHEEVRAILVDRVPEVADGHVEIMAIARSDSGLKIAVRPHRPVANPFTPFLAYPKRMEDISARLGVANPAIVEYHDDPVRFVANAFRPVPVIASTVLDPDKRLIRIIVERGKDYARALGKAGANVQLVRDLTGWNVTICTDECAGRLHFHNPAGTPSSPVHNVATLAEAEFIAVVRENVAMSSRHMATWTRLTSPMLISRTRDALVHLLYVLESRRDPQHGYTEEQSQWRKDLEAALTVTKPAYKDTLRQISEEAAACRRHLRQLATAVAVHRAHFDGTARTSADSALWALLDDLSIPDGSARVMTTLTGMLAGPWSETAAPQHFPA